MKGHVSTALNPPIAGLSIHESNRSAGLQAIGQYCHDEDVVCISVTRCAINDEFLLTFEPAEDYLAIRPVVVISSMVKGIRYK